MDLIQPLLPSTQTFVICQKCCWNCKIIIYTMSITPRSKNNAWCPDTPKFAFNNTGILLNVSIGSYSKVMYSHTCSSVLL